MSTSQSISRVIVTCGSNTLRSPTFAHLLRNALEQADLRDIVVESAGIDNAHRKGEPAEEENAAYILKNFGISLKGHRSRYLGDLNPTETDLIVTVDHVDQYVVADEHPRSPTLLVRNGKGIDSPHMLDSKFDGMVGQIKEAVEEVVALIQSGDITPPTPEV